MSIKVLVVDGHELVRVGLVSLFNGTNIHVVAQAGSGREGIKLARKEKPNLVLLEVQLPDMDGFDALEQILAAAPASRVVILSAYDNPTYVARATVLGACDFLLKRTSRQQLIGAVTAAAQGDSPCRCGEMLRVIETMSTSQVSGKGETPLTRREEQVLRHIAFGLSNREIGWALGISVETVKEHVQNLLRKIPVTDRTQAAVWAMRKGVAW